MSDEEGIITVQEKKNLRPRVKREETGQVGGLYVYRREEKKEKTS